MNDQSLPVQSEGLMPRTLDDAIKFSQIQAKSDMIPKEFIEKPANVLVAVQWGMELGLQPLQAMQNIAVINGRPSLWGDAVIALVRASPLCEWIKEELTADGATCTTKRRGDPEPQSRSFTFEDAKKAGLAGKQGPWTNYPKRMVQMRARAWCLRDVYPDVLRGMPIAEEVMDIPPEKDVTTLGSHTTTEVEMPREKAPETFQGTASATTEAVEPAAKSGELLPREEPKAAADKSKPAPASQVAMIRKKAEQQTITMEEISKRFKLPYPTDEQPDLDPLAGITTDQGNAILNWLRDPTQ